MCSYIVRPLGFSIRYTESSVTDRKPLGFDDGVPIGSDKIEGSVVILMTSLMLSVEAGVHI